MNKKEHEFYRGLPSKRMAAGVLFFNEAGEVLLVEPTYKKVWEIPGGVVEENESPRAAAVREVKEELGLRINPVALSLVVLDYMAANGERTEALMFVFYGGVLSIAQQQAVRVPLEELRSFRFVRPSDLRGFLSQRMADRVLRSIDTIGGKGFSYFEAGGGGSV